VVAVVVETAVLAVEAEPVLIANLACSRYQIWALLKQSRLARAVRVEVATAMATLGLIQHLAAF
tara:strand:+ start:41 stop:232 length:192 start_codon:yes stop_codon:yes gene_type:complete